MRSSAVRCSTMPRSTTRSTSTHRKSGPGNPACRAWSTTRTRRSRHRSSLQQLQTRSDGLGELTQVCRRDDVGRHQVDQPAEGTDPDAGFDKAALQFGRPAPTASSRPRRSHRARAHRRRPDARRAAPAPCAAVPRWPAPAPATDFRAAARYCALRLQQPAGWP